jgi:hypothetical protein
MENVDCKNEVNDIDLNFDLIFDLTEDHTNNIENDDWNMSEIDKFDINDIDINEVDKFDINKINIKKIDMKNNNTKKNPLNIPTNEELTKFREQIKHEAMLKKMDEKIIKMISDISKCGNEKNILADNYSTDCENVENDVLSQDEYFELKNQLEYFRKYERICKLNALEIELNKEMKRKDIDLIKYFQIKDECIQLRTEIEIEHLNLDTQLNTDDK